MTEIIYIAVNTLLIGFVFALPGILWNRWLVKEGIVRDSTGPLLVLVFGLVLIREIWYKDISWWYFVLAIIPVITLGIHGPDMWTTMNRGRWWWKPK